MDGRMDLLDMQLTMIVLILVIFMIDEFQIYHICASFKS
jgi:hypothetical protein